MPVNWPPKRAAYNVIPHAGGTFTVFLAMRTALARHGIELQWIGVSNKPDSIAQSPQFAAYMNCGHLIDARSLSDHQVGMEVLRKVLDNSMDLVFVNAGTNPREVSIAPYLPPDIRRVMILHSITLGTYDAARVLQPFVHAGVGVCPRIHNYMLDRMKMPPDAAFCVANSMDFTPFENLQRTPSSGTLRVLYLGRVNDTEKGAFFVPPILSRLRDLPVKLTIAGDGPDLPELRRRLAPEADRVNFLGSVPITDVPSLVATHDILLLPSRFEGFGYSLIEAMAGGCVPVASRVTGATDFVVQHEKTGLLFPTGDVAAAADAIRRLHNQPQLLQTCANNGLIDVRNRFSIDAMSAAYTRVLNALQNPRHLPNLKTGQPFELLPIANQWRRFLPAPVKNLLRKFVYK